MHGAVLVVTHPDCASVGVPGALLADGAAASLTDPGHALGSLYLPPAALPSFPVTLLPQKAMDHEGISVTERVRELTTR